MTKIEKLEKDAYVIHDGQYVFPREKYEELKSAISEQVVLDALPDELITDICTSKHNSDYTGTYQRVHHDKIDGAKKLRSLAVERLTTRKEMLQPYLELLKTIRMHKADNGKYFLTKELCKDIDELYTLTDGK